MHRIIAGILLLISSVLLGLSIAGIALIWIYKEPLVLVSTARLRFADNELGQAHTVLKNAELELERTLRTIDAAEKSMLLLKAELVYVKILFAGVNGTLESQLLPGLKASRAKMDQAKSSLLDLQASLKNLNSLPFLNLNLPGDPLLADLIASAGSMDVQITRVEDLVKKASTFLGDASYLAGGDFTETRDNLRHFLTVVQEYDQKLTGWHAQLAMWTGSLSGWVETASLSLTIFLIWFGFSQFGLILHGLDIWRNNALRIKQPVQVVENVQI